jgi:acyl-CoA synthetase (AMP-forming)/AMP-acid ligase II
MYRALPTIAAASTGAAAYLNAKYHIAKDLRSLYSAQSAQWHFNRAKSRGELTVWSGFNRCVDRYPHADCIWTPPQTYSWLQTRQMVLRFANFFLAKGVRREEIVGFYLQNSAEFMFAWLALLAIGAVPAMINFNLEGSGLVHCVKVSEARIMLVDEDIQHHVHDNSGLQALGLDFVILDDDIKARIAGLEPKELDESVTGANNETNALALRYTSGTTGFPKAVRTPQSRMLLFAYGKYKEMGVKGGSNGDRWFVCMPICHATAGSTAMVSLIMGITLCIV